jgi:hypothetical protein
MCVILAVKSMEVGTCHFTWIPKSQAPNLVRESIENKKKTKTKTK